MTLLTQNNPRTFYTINGMGIKNFISKGRQRNLDRSDISFFRLLSLHYCYGSHVPEIYDMNDSIHSNLYKLKVTSPRLKS